MTDDDPEDSPIERQVLYTNDVQRIVASFVQGLFTVARPDRVRRAMETILENWDSRVQLHERMVNATRDTLVPPPPKGPAS